MTSPVRTSETPFVVDVVEGKDYWWCACGLSKAQPFCDGSHKLAGEFMPVQYKATSDTTVAFCGCKATGHAPICDGSHQDPV